MRSERVVDDSSLCRFFARKMSLGYGSASTAEPVSEELNPRICFTN
jgi:hypothetical protein